MTDTQTSELRPFSDWLTDHAQGLVDQEMTQALAELVAAVSHYRKKGSVSLKVEVDPAGSGGRTVSTKCTVTSKAPEADAELSIFYVDENGGLHREDPFQPSFDDVKRVDESTGEIRRPTNEKD